MLTYDFDVLWADLCRGSAPHPLGARSSETTSSWHGRAMADEVYRDLADRGLATGGREVDTELVRLLRLLRDHDHSVHLVGHLGYPVSALAASDGTSGVLAVLAGGELWLTAVGPCGLAAAITDLLVTGRRPVTPERGCQRPGAPATRSRTTGVVTGRFGFSAPRGRPVPSALTWLETERGQLVVVEEPQLSSALTDRDGLARRIDAQLSSFAAGAPARS